MSRKAGEKPGAAWHALPVLADIARAIRETGGRALLVGGGVRDQLLERGVDDLDIEVLGLDLDALQALLIRFGDPIRLGRSYEIIRLRGLDVDFSVAASPDLDFAQAARRRDLTINSIAIDPLTDEILDPHGGRQDLAAKVLRATHATSFGDDPLRALRVARFTACFEMEPDAELERLCAEQDLAGVSAERSFDEIRRTLLEADRPSRALAFLEKTRLLRYFPEIEALAGVPQDSEWHPEGDVHVHTLMVVDEAARLRAGDDDDIALMLGALCHDLGKPLCTEEHGGRIRSLAHDRLGVPPTRALLGRLRAPVQLVTRVAALVEHHLAPALFLKNGAGARGYRRLARKLEAAGVSMQLLERVARADHFGRTTEEALARCFPAGDAFLDRAAEQGVEASGPIDVVQGRHLVARGLSPGPHFGEILERCRRIQDETGETNAERILEEVLPD
ncbi:MAG: polynucleotide adenylyltransferase [Deltaproteobacteria bacterium]|nr:polynucleotide adenylyltransferase [Deltaproteobacteria bacterium]